ncbi:MAG: SDR family oxidoreductase [Lewinellaceae bacterium]|nr:SDR family oxidoreductase [Lewinellaceae bacterium]
MGKVILITGASSGLGKALAEILSSREHIVYGTSRRPCATPLPYRMIFMEVKDENSIRSGIQHIIEQEGRIDVVINNAGIGLAGPTEQIRLDNIRELLDINVLGVVRVCQAVLPHMRARRSGRIINISSIGAVIGLPYRGLYCASKSAVSIMTESLRMEIAPFGIQACCVRAGDTRTNINANRIKDVGDGGPAYLERFNRVYAAIDREVNEGMPAEEAARQIARLVDRSRLRRYYTVGKPLQRAALWVKRLLPDAAFEKLMANYSGM